MKVPGIGPGESYTGLLGRSVQQNGYWSKDPEYRLGAVFKGDWQVTSRYVIMERATPVGCSVTRFTSRSQQPPFASANDVTGITRYNHVTGECN